MHTLIALIVPVFSAFFQPVMGGDVSVRQLAETRPVQLALNGDAACTVELTEEEATYFTEVLADVSRNGVLGECLTLHFGGSVRIVNIDDGDLRVLTNALADCEVTLLADEGEPGVLISTLIAAAR